MGKATKSAEEKLKKAQDKVTSLEKKLKIAKEERRNMVTNLDNKENELLNVRGEKEELSYLPGEFKELQMAGIIAEETISSSSLTMAGTQMKNNWRTTRAISIVDTTEARTRRR